jgi:sec-independent protein translocase protein TatB
MFEFDAGKLIIIGIVALIVIGPKELPRVMRHVGEALVKMRRMAAEFRAQFLDAMRESELEEIKAGVEKLADNSKPDFGIDPLAQIKAELTHALEAAEKPASLPAESATALAASQKEDFATDNASSAVPNSPETAGAPAFEAVDAQMQAVADALTAEIGEATPVSAVGDTAKAHAGR